MPITMRDYQERAIAACVEKAAAGHRRVIVNHPTGCGKTVLAVEMARRALAKSDGDVLWLTHREELADQTARTATAIGIPADEVGVVMADRDEHDRRLVIASLPTLWQERRLDRVVRGGSRRFRLAIYDEVHHAAARCNRAVLDALPWDPFVIGLTATIERGDGGSLKDVFPGGIAHQLPLSDAIRDG